MNSLSTTPFRCFKSEPLLSCDIRLGSIFPPSFVDKTYPNGHNSCCNNLPPSRPRRQHRRPSRRCRRPRPQWRAYRCSSCTSGATAVHKGEHLDATNQPWHKRTDRQSYGRAMKLVVQRKGTGGWSSLAIGWGTEREHAHHYRAEKRRGCHCRERLQ